MPGRLIIQRANGQYNLMWWDTHAGKPIKTDNATSKDGALVVDIPTFQMDMAVKGRSGK
jgi:hypothetical protein